MGSARCRVSIFPFHGTDFILSEDKSDNALCQAVVPLDCALSDSCLRGPTKFSLP